LVIIPYIYRAMIVKILSASATFSGVRYNEDKVAKSTAQLLASENFSLLHLDQGAGRSQAGRTGRETPQQETMTMEQPNPSPETRKPLYRLVTRGSAAESTFDAASLDKVYALLAEYLVSDACTYGVQYAGLLSDVRRMRDALLQGSGSPHFQKHPPDKL
jgi:hypothetical protein